MRVLSSFARLWGLARSAVIYRANPWKRRRARAFYAGLIRPGHLAFDVGAHLGDRTAVFLALGARVVAVEPQPLLAEFLARLHGRTPEFALVRAALGPAAGEATLLIADRNPTVATLSPEWIAEIRQDPGFAGIDWARRLTVPVTTLDALIATHGRPDFIKLDAEGFEAEILSGLSQPVPALSFEALPATPDRALACLDRLDQLGRYRFNFVAGERFRFSHAAWLDRGEIRRFLAARRIGDGSGDVYARLD